MTASSNQSGLGQSEVPKTTSGASATTLPKSKTKQPMSKYKKRQYALAAGIFLLVAAFGFSLSYQINSSKEEMEKQKASPAADLEAKSNFSTSTEMLDGPAFWQNTQGAKTDAQEKRIADLEKLMTEQKNQAKSPDLGLPSMATAGSSTLPPVPPSNLNVGAPVGSILIPEVQKSKIETIVAGQNGTFSSTGLTTSGQGQSLAQNPKNPSIANTTDTAYVKGVNPNIVVTEDGGNVDYLRSNSGVGNSPLNSTGKFRAQKSYIPTGTFLPVVLLGGLDAPTGGESSTANPHPVLMQVTSFAQLPNNFKRNFKKCFITGTAYGDLSSERAMIRTEQLSCVGTDGRALDIPIKGWVAGDDGKTGVRGRLVTKQGAVLKNALLTGVLSGIGQGFASAAQVSSTSGLGTVSSVSSGKQMQAALGQGVGGAFDRLAQYYVKLADKMFPVIEVDAGRSGDVVLLKGFQIDGE